MSLPGQAPNSPLAWQPLLQHLHATEPSRPPPTSLPQFLLAAPSVVFFSSASLLLSTPLSLPGLASGYAHPCLLTPASTYMCQALCWGLHQQRPVTLSQPSEGSGYCWPCFIHGETEAQADEDTCPVSLGYWEMGLGLQRRQSKPSAPDLDL